MGKDGLPMLYFLDTCVDSVRTIPVLQHDETKPEDVDSDMEDHAGDETRYAVMSRPWTVDEAKPETRELPNEPVRFTINELVERVTARRLREEADA